MNYGFRWEYRLWRSWGHSRWTSFWNAIFKPEPYPPRRRP